MKTNKIIFITIFCLIILTAYCEDFLLGAYLYNKNIHPTGYHRTLCDSLRSAGFNAAISSAEDSTGSESVWEMLEIMKLYDIDAILEDYIFDPPSGNYGARTLAMGNYFRFEAEYNDNSNISENDQIQPDKYFYMSSDANNARIGHYVMRVDFSNNNCWYVAKGQKGYAYYDLTYRFPQTNNLKQFRRVGPEFRFPESRTGGYDLFNNNVLYVTFAMYCPEADAMTDNPVLAEITLTCKGKYTNSKDPAIIIPHNFGTSPVADKTYLTREMYQNSPTDPQNPLIRLITVEVPVSVLNSVGVLEKGPTFDKMLKNLNPNLYWNGHGNLVLDYIEFKDKLYRDYTSQDSVLAKMRTFDLSYLYGYDEPAQGQFESFRVISRYLQSHGNTQLIAAVHKYVPVVKTKYKNEPYSHRKAFFDTVDPPVMVIDEFPFTGSVSPDWGNPQSDSFVQNYIDKVAVEYDLCRKMCGDSTAFFTVPQTYGRWTNDARPPSWYFLYPPDKVSLSLQLLPLCYQASGIIDFKFHSGGKNAFALLNTYGTREINSTPQYEAVKAANQKIKVYGPLIKKLKWLGAGTVMTSSPTGVPLSDFFLDRIYVPANRNSPLYQGYVQAGFFLDEATGRPAFMLVNRRANTAPDNLSLISPHSDPPLAEYNSLCRDAPPQTVRFVLSRKAFRLFGKKLGLYDPYTDKIYPLKRRKVDIPLAPGDGKLLQLVKLP